MVEHKNNSSAEIADCEKSPLQFQKIPPLPKTIVLVAYFLCNTKCNRTNQYNSSSAANVLLVTILLLQQNLTTDACIRNTRELKTTRGHMMPPPLHLSHILCNCFLYRRCCNKQITLMKLAMHERTNQGVIMSAVEQT